MNKRLNIMFYSTETGERIVLPVNPENIEIKYEKSFESYNILDFGQINISGKRLPLEIKLNCFLPDEDSVFALGANMSYINGVYIENVYSVSNVVSVFKSWAEGEDKIRLVIDEELNIEGKIKYFKDVIRENTTSRKCEIEFLEYRNPAVKIAGSSGLFKRAGSLIAPKTLLMKNGDTIYSIAKKFGKKFKDILKKNKETDPNKNLAGKIIRL